MFSNVSRCIFWEKAVCFADLAAKNFEKGLHNKKFFCTMKLYFYRTVARTAGPRRCFGAGPGVSSDYDFRKR